MSSVRLRRLQADYERLREFLLRQPRVRLIQAQGNPPERYQLEYQIKGLRQVDDQLQTVASHVVEIMLPLSYPRMAPQCRMLTPVFHPNIAPHAICIGDHWSAGEPLWSMVARIGEMIAYQTYNTKSPLNGEAARWVEEHQGELPLDRTIFAMDELSRDASERPVAAQGPAAPQPVAPLRQPVAAVQRPPQPSPAQLAAPVAQAVPVAVAAPMIVIECAGCRTRYRVPVQAAAKRVRCKTCQGILEIPAGSASP
jgi:ubiquitin-protein ligase